MQDNAVQYFHNITHLEQKRTSPDINLKANSLQNTDHT